MHKSVCDCLILSLYLQRNSTEWKFTKENAERERKVFEKRPQQEGVFLWGLATLSQLNAPSFSVCGAQSIIQAHLIKLLSSFQSLKSKRNLLAASILSLKKASTMGLIRLPWKLFKQRIVQFPGRSGFSINSYRLLQAQHCSRQSAFSPGSEFSCHSPHTSGSQGRGLRGQAFSQGQQKSCVLGVVAQESPAQALPSPLWTSLFSSAKWEWYSPQKSKAVMKVKTYLWHIPIQSHPNAVPLWLSIT